MRRPWFAVPCCPSNLSRTWADLGKYIYSHAGEEIRIHQYISSEYIGAGDPENQHTWKPGNKRPRGVKTKQLHVEIHSELPWNGKVRIKIYPPIRKILTLFLRNPSWSKSTGVKIEGEDIPKIVSEGLPDEFSASGFDPRPSRWISIRRNWSPGDVVELDFDMSIQVRLAHPRVKSLRGKAAITRGPLVYCLESVDNPSIDLFKARLDPPSLRTVFDKSMFGGIAKIEGKTQAGDSLSFIPYMLWGNRGESQMSVYVNV
jgi:DUF1680 family protein